jgi:hypothetical protein
MKIKRRPARNLGLPMKEPPPGFVRLPLTGAIVPQSYLRFMAGHHKTTPMEKLDGSAPTPTDSPSVQIIPVKLAWEVLPAGHVEFANLKAHYQLRSEAQSNRVWDLSRLEFVHTLGPAQCFVGSEDFDGYVVFTFPRIGKAVLDNPLHGNACYIISGEWQGLSRLSKKELLGSHTQNVIRVIHRGDWRKRARSLLRGYR